MFFNVPAILTLSAAEGPLTKSKQGESLDVMSCPMPTQPPPAITSAICWYITEGAHCKALWPSSQVLADSSRILLGVYLAGGAVRLYRAVKAYALVPNMLQVTGIQPQTSTFSS